MYGVLSPWPYLPTQNDFKQKKTCDLFQEGCEQPHNLYKFLILEFNTHTHTKLLWLYTYGMPLQGLFWAKEQRSL
jgi:hypothetical protein